jgi:hypothetical protein
MAKVRWAVRCSATNKTTGGPCGQWAITGGYVCWHHGGASPVVRRAAARRWEFELMMRRLERKYGGGLALAWIRAQFAPDPATFRRHRAADDDSTWCPRFVPLDLDELAREHGRAEG